MRILYLSCHSVLEFDEVKLFTEIPELVNPGFGIEVFSMGAYSNPTQSGDYKRSVVPKGVFYSNLFDIAMQCDKDRIHPELLEWADVVVSMHNSKLPNQKEEQPWIVRNWQLFQQAKKKIVWRSIGQSTPAIEQELARYRGLGLKIVRYSPLEQKIPSYCGEDALIRFYKDEAEFAGWNGRKKQVITVAQSFKKRGAHLGYPIFEQATHGFFTKVYGTDNEDLGDLYGGSPSYEELKSTMRDARVFFYFGTVPAPYTLSLIEAMMTGIPVVAVGKKLRTLHPYDWENYELPDIISNGVNGYISDSIEELRSYIKMLLEDDLLAQRIGEAGRKTAIDLFGKARIVREWSDFFRRIQ